jgi:putative glycosyltransferase (TIGR04372 family)
MLTNNIIKSNSGYIRILKILFWGIFNLLLIPVAVFLYLISPVIKIIFVKIRDDRIGHLAANTELFLRRLKMGIIRKKGILFIGIASTKPSNKQLLTMFKRKMIIIQLPRLLVDILFSETSLLVKSGFGMQLLINTNEYKEFSYAKPNLKFTAAEEKNGKELLKKMGISSRDWFICFHARDHKYLNKYFNFVDESYHNFRDWDINTALKAVEYITSKGGFAIRMGAVIEKKLPNLKNPKIIDYASNYRSDFGDIYLSAKCKFFLGDGCGINQVAEIFNVPEAWVNRLPIANPPWSVRGIYIPKKLWSIKKKRFLTFREIIDLGISNSWRAEEYIDAKVKWIDNTPKEILDLVIEMNERLDGKFKYTKEDQELQKKFKSLFKKGDHCYGFLSRIGAKFLRENKKLLN